MSESWYVVHTQPQREAVAETSLQRVCERVFCPRYRQRVILHGYRREVTRPLFPSYLFAAFDRGRDFQVVTFSFDPSEPSELAAAARV